MKKKFKQAPMVNWFHPMVLAQSGLKSVISKMFGNYADRRETQAALDDKLARDAWEIQTTKYQEAGEIWVDFLSDTGDGFDPTYSVAVTAAQDSLQFSRSNGETLSLPRAKIMVLGGDMIYPTPSSELYENNFKIPFESALPQGEKKEDDPEHPHLYAIPGNHDWYDGLGNFMKIFCQQRWIGNWKTYQLRSYFAIPLPNNYWLWATDIQLNEDIDKPQQDYFRDIAREKMQEGDKVILCTAEPAWVYRQMYTEDQSYDRLQYFIDHYITHKAIKCPAKTFKLAVILTGDLHHYTHYCPEATDDTELKAQNESHFSGHYIGAGGGGAFMHLTHNLPKKLDRLDAGEVVMRASFPNDQQSKSLLWGNLFFVKHNFYFSFLLGCLHVLFFWLLSSQFNTDPLSFSKNGELLQARINLTTHITELDFCAYFWFCAGELLKTPSVLILSLLIICGFTGFADTKTGKRWIWVWGLAHGLLQFCLIFLLLFWLPRLSHCWLSIDGYWFNPVTALLLLICGTLISGSLMGLYLILSDLLLHIHIDESSSSLICEDYKNFLRMHISKDALTIYPIGIKKVTRHWETIAVDDNNYRFSGENPAYELIEEPITIKLN